MKDALFYVVRDIQFLFKVHYFYVALIGGCCAFNAVVTLAVLEFV